jgi:hypothetical protein
MRRIRDKNNDELFEIESKGYELYEKELKRIHSQKERIAELLQNYFDSVKEVKESEDLPPEEKLKKLLTPIIALHQILQPDYLKYHEFVDIEHIDMSNELDFENLKYDSDKYDINPCIKVDDSAFLETNNRDIYLSNEYKAYLIKEAFKSKKLSIFCFCNTPVTLGGHTYKYHWGKGSWIRKDLKEADESIQDRIRQLEEALEEQEVDGLIQQKIESDLEPGLQIPRRMSVEEIYELWLPTLEQERIKSRDLLEQILVCYTIKRALNGDEKAVDKLYDLYQDTAIGTAINMAKRRELYDFLEDIRQEAQLFLKLIISGFNPLIIMNSLTKDSAIIPIPKSIKKFYIWHYAEYVPFLIEETYKEEIIRLILSHNYFLSDLCILLNPYVFMQSKTRWIAPKGKRLNRFNSYSFIPTKKTNLTVWLFGTKKNHMQGRYCQIISESALKRYDKMRKEIRLGTTYLEDTVDEDGEILPPDEETDKKRNKQVKHKEYIPCINREIIAKVFERLQKDGVKKRDMEIFLKNKLHGFNKTKLGEEYNLSRKQIYRICKNLSSKYLQNYFQTISP